MATITVGSPAVSQTSGFDTTQYLLLKYGAANADGTITSIEVYPYAAISGLIVGIFFLVSGIIYQCRSVVSIGSVAAGAKRTFSVSLAVKAGDFLGCQYSGGSIAQVSGSNTTFYASSGNFTVGGQTSWQFGSGATLSLQGIGSDVTSYIKTINGLVRASVKSHNGLLIASVKSIDGLA